MQVFSADENPLRKTTGWCNIVNGTKISSNNSRSLVFVEVIQLLVVITLIIVGSSIGVNNTLLQFVIVTNTQY